MEGGDGSSSVSVFVSCRVCAGGDAGGGQERANNCGGEGGGLIEGDDDYETWIGPFKV